MKGQREETAWPGKGFRKRQETLEDAALKKVDGYQWFNFSLFIPLFQKYILKWQPGRIASHWYTCVQYIRKHITECRWDSLYIIHALPKPALMTLTNSVINILNLDLQSVPIKWMAKWFQIFGPHCFFRTMFRMMRWMQPEEPSIRKCVMTTQNNWVNSVPDR